MWRSRQGLGIDRELTWSLSFMISYFKNLCKRSRNDIPKNVFSPLRVMQMLLPIQLPVAYYLQIACRISDWYVFWTEGAASSKFVFLCSSVFIFVIIFSRVRARCRLGAWRNSRPPPSRTPRAVRISPSFPAPPRDASFQNW